MDIGRSTVFYVPKEVEHGTPVPKPKHLIQPPKKTTLLPSELPREEAPRTRNCEKSIKMMQSSKALPGNYDSSNFAQTPIERRIFKSQANRESGPVPMTPTEKERMARLQQQMKRTEAPRVNSYKCKAIRDKFCHGLLLED
jgi:hypothetical protein